MGKGAKRAFRVEKARAPKQQRSEPPRWFYRVMRLRVDQETFLPKDPRGFSRRDFDEDLSELESESEQEDDAKPVEEHNEDCECGCEDSDCDCHRSAGDDTEDEESERSYDGSDAGDYYALKREREERKWEKLQEREDKDGELEFERSKEEEVRSAFKSLRKARKEHRTIPIESLAGQHFQLFCSEHLNHFYDADEDFNMQKTLEFYVDEDCDNPVQKSGDETAMLYGCVYLDLDGHCKFGPFRPPRNAGWEPVKVKSFDGKYELSFLFLGNGFLKLRVSRAMVMDLCRTNTPPPDALEVFDFVGIWCDPEKLAAEHKEAVMEQRRQRSPSPRESWFELNHPMGSWAQAWGSGW